MVPMVFSLLNIPATINNHFQDMDGAYSFAFDPYWKLNLTQELFTPRTDDIWEVEDMFRYRARLDGVPKVEIVSSGDQFFLLDDSLQWWDDMPGPKWMAMLPNAEHSMVPHQGQLVDTTTSFWISLLENITLPEVSWTMQETELGGLIVVDMIPLPENVTAYVATTLVNDTRRDFRLTELGDDGNLNLHRVSWTEDINVIDFGNGYQYGAAAEKVDDEWVGFFIQGTWEGPAPHYYPLTFTTQVNVVPYTRPRGPCLSNDECYGYLV